MNWKNLFATHILERGYDYYLENAVENIDISDDIIRADVIGSEDYEVEISLSNGAVTDMYCSCPYALDGRNCKHMAAVLYEWSGNDIEEDEEMETAVNTDLFEPAYTINAYKKKLAAVEELVAGAEEDEVRSFLVSVLAEDEKLLLRFHNTVNKQVTKEDINNYIRQVDMIADRYLGRENSRTAMNQDEYQKKYAELEKRYDKTKAEYDRIADSIVETQKKEEQFKQFIATLENTEAAITEFDEGMWCSMVECMTVYQKDNIVITLVGGMEVAI